MTILSVLVAAAGAYAFGALWYMVNAKAAAIQALVYGKCQGLDGRGGC